MLNNKGQSLVAFVLIIPIVLMILILVLDVGRMYLLRRELDNINYITLDYAIDKIDDNNIKTKILEIIEINDQDIIIKKNIIEDGKIYLVTEKKYDGYFLGFISDELVNIESSYVGYLVDGKKYIERVK